MRMGHWGFKMRATDTEHKFIDEQNIRKENEYKLLFEAVKYLKRISESLKEIESKMP